MRFRSWIQLARAEFGLILFLDRCNTQPTFPAFGHFTSQDRNLIDSELENKNTPSHQSLAKKARLTDWTLIDDTLFFPSFSRVCSFSCDICSHHPLLLLSGVRNLAMIKIHRLQEIPGPSWSTSSLCFPAKCPNYGQDSHLLPEPCFVRPLLILHLPCMVERLKSSGHRLVWLLVYVSVVFPCHEN